jgi:Tol biopolymer transport system component
MARFSISILIIAITLLSLGGCKDTGNNPIEPPETNYYLHDFSPSWSGSNGLIAYVHFHYIGKQYYPDSSGIYLIYPDGAGKRFFFQHYYIYNLDWSPDGQWIVYNCGTGLYKVSYPEGILDTIKSPGEYFEPAWAPDGQKILSSNTSINGLFLIDADGSDYRNIVSYARYGVWLLNDSIIYVSYNYSHGAICIADSAGNNEHIVYSNADFRFGYDLTLKANLLTGRIIFAGYEMGKKTCIWKFDRETNTPGLLYGNHSDYANFSPDGSKIVFSIYSTGNDNLGNLWIINWDGTGLRQLTE